MPEVKPDFPREWVEFIDPADPDGSDFFRCDITWLTSSWSCIYGNGCQGIYAQTPHDGCCSEGAMYSDKDDEKRVLKYAAKLKRSEWQFYDQARPKRKGGKLNISEIDEDNERKTRTVNNSCIFLNRKGEFPTFGCVLHHLAEQEGSHFLDVKPDVCWQLPIRRSYETREYENGTDYQVIVIEEYRRKNWGSGGETMDWYCSSDTEAHHAFEPVYVSEKDTLIELIGEKNYEILKKHCDERVSLIKTLKKLPGRKAKQILLSINPHPADQLVE